jgi:hypothetical protein
MTSVSYSMRSFDLVKSLDKVAGSVPGRGGGDNGYWRLGGRQLSKVRVYILLQTDRIVPSSPGLKVDLSPH